MLSVRLGIDIEALFIVTCDDLPSTGDIAALPPCFGQAGCIAQDQHFHDWELVFTEVLGPAVSDLPSPRGFDLILGNPLPPEAVIGEDRLEVEEIVDSNAVDVLLPDPCPLTRCLAHC